MGGGWENFSQSLIFLLGCSRIASLIWLFCKLGFKRIIFIFNGTRDCFAVVCRLVGLANVLIVGWQNFKFFCAVWKKLKHEAVGFCIGKKSA